MAPSQPVIKQQYSPADGLRWPLKNHPDQLISPITNPCLIHLHVLPHHLYLYISTSWSCHVFVLTVQEDEKHLFSNWLPIRVEYQHRRSRHPVYRSLSCQLTDLDLCVEIAPLSSQTDLSTDVDPLDPGQDLRWCV